MRDKVNIYREPLFIRFAGIDQSDTLTPASACDLFQEAAITHAELLGVGRNAMRETGQVWILSRLSVFMEQRPRFGEKVLIRTWPRGSNKLFAIRDYDIHIDNTAGMEDPGTAIVRGRSAWLIVDIEKHRPLRPQPVVEKFPLNEGLNALDNEVPPSLAVRTFSAEPVLRRAVYSDIDYNAHVNNTRYIQWIQDLLDPKLLEMAKKIRLDINYLLEVRYGETIKLYAEPIAADTTALPELCTAAFAIEGRRDNVPVFRAELRLWN
ncbi:acyl-ACP thioesterase [Spirochaetia bacterium]|nr:acyl-ACP thioesterase [Spirochaetia bacterium]